MPISISMSKMIFIKYLLPVKPKLVPILKVSRIYRNLAHFIYANLNFDVKNDFYLPPFSSRVAPTLEVPRTY